MNYLDSWNDLRIELAKKYSIMFEKSDIIHPVIKRENKHVFHLYVIRTMLRDSLKTWLESNGISCGIHYVLPIHLQPIYKEMFGFKEGLYPKAEELCKTCLSIPIYPQISSGEISFISDKIHDFFEKKA